MRQRKLAIGTILGLVVAGLLLMLPAGAVDTGTDLAWSEPMNHEPYWEAYFGADCTKYEGHSGAIPAGYEAVVVHDGQWVRVYYPVSGAFTALGPFNYNTQNPDDHFAGPHSWVMKCNIETTEETTSTVTEESTTTLDETTTTEQGSTTTVADSTTTTVDSSTTTTAPDGLVATWSASSSCQTLTAEWGEGISSVELYLVDPQFGEIQVDGFLEPGSKDATTAKGAEWVLVPVVISGYTPQPDEIRLFTEVCDETTTTISGSSTSAPELPFTGAQAEALALSALALIGVGGLVVYTVRGRTE